jgi:hypothetical protein
LAVILAGCLAVFLLRAKEPAYQGKTVTEWLIRRWNSVLEESDDEGSKKALKEIGTNAVPVLLKMVVANGNLKSDTPIFAGSGHKAVYTNSLSPTVQRQLAWVGFASLGTNAMSAVPKLLRLARHRDGAVRIAALSCLKPIHPDKKTALPVVAAGLREADPFVQLTAARFIHDRYPEEMARFGVVVQIRRLTKANDADIRKKALDCLDSLELNKDEFVGTLAASLRDADAGVKWEAGKILVARFPKDAERLGVYKMFPELKTGNQPQVKRG